MALRTAGVGDERKLQIWDQYGVKRYDFSPSEMTTPGVVTFELEYLLVSDTDPTPVGAVLLKVLDQKLKLRNAADDADVILDEVFIPHTFANFVNFDGGIKAAGVESTDNIILSGAAGVRRLQGIINIEGAETAALVITAGCYPASSKEQLLTLLGSPNHGAGINLYGEDHFYTGTIWLYTPNAAKDTTINRLKIEGAADVVDAIWTSTLQSGLKLKDALDANSQKITNLLDPTAAQDGATKTYVDAAVAAAITGLDWQESVLDKDLNTPPGAPGAGDRYIVAAAAVGAWTGHEDEIAEWDGAAWVFAVPTEGFCCEVEDEDLAYVYDGAVWVLFGSILAFGDDVFATFGTVARLGWDTTDPNANMIKLDLPVGGVVDVPAFLVGIGIRAADLAVLDGITEPVMGVVDVAKTSWASFGFGAAAAPQLNCGGVATDIGCAPRFVAEKQLNLDASTELTIDGAGAIAITKSFHRVDTFGDGPTSDLDSITGGVDGDILVLKAEDSARTVVCKHGTGNLQLNGSADFSMGHINDSITLIYDGANWLELSRSNNGV